MKPLRGEARKEDRTPANSGDFTLKGAWNPAADKAGRGPLYAFIRDLARARNASKLSPAAIAEQIAATNWRWAFGELDQWLTLTRWDDWPFAWCRTSADAAVKYCGVGSGVEHSHFEQGSFVAGEDQRRFVPVDREKVAAFVASIGTKLSDPGSPKPVSGSQAKSGHYPHCNCEQCFADAWETAKRAAGKGE